MGANLFISITTRSVVLVSHRYTTAPFTVEPLNKGHFGIMYREVVLISEVDLHKEEPCPLYRGCPYLGGQ